MRDLFDYCEIDTLQLIFYMTDYLTVWYYLWGNGLDPLHCRNFGRNPTQHMMYLHKHMIFKLSYHLS